ncbi:Satratoxin biosynthesis SC1 cluster protein 4 [Metarhizium anisopliae]
MNMTQTLCNRPMRDKAATYQIVSNTLVIIAALFIVQRFAYKFYARLELGLDDWCTLLTLVAGIPSTVINAHFLTVNGIGRDIWTLTPEQITKFSLYFYMDEIIYLAEVSLAKLALLFFYMRIFPSRNVQRLLWGTIAFDIAFGLAFVLVAIFQCKPVNYFWVMWDGEHEGQCLNINAITWSNAIISISMDVWMLAIPLWQLRTLRLGWKKKAGVAAMFSVGALETTQQYYADRRTGDKMHNTGSRGGGGDSQHGRDGNAAGEGGNGIWYQKSFTVKYVEADELQLVSVRDRDRASAKSESSLR